MENIGKYKYINFFWAALVFLMCSLPVNFQFVKIILIILIFVVSVFIKKENAFVIDKRLAFAYGLWMVYAVYTFTLGVINNNPGAFPFFKINILYFSLLFLVVVVAKNKYIFKSTIKAVYLSNWFISAYTFYLLLYSFGIRFGNRLIILDDTAAVGLHIGYTHITNTNLSMTIFTFPFMCILFKNITDKGIVKTKWLVANLFFTAAAMFLSGRRILWLILIISLMLFILKGGFSMKRKVKYALLTLGLAAIGLIVLSQYYEISFAGYIDRFLDVFSKTNDYEGENVRYVQMSYLMKAFWDNPVIGAGGGAILPNYYRSSENPWIFECTYHVILFNSGIIGSMFFLGSLVSILHELRKTDKVEKVGVICAFVLSLFANATNPYMTASFDFWIFMFIPLMYLAYSRELSQNII